MTLKKVLIAGATGLVGYAAMKHFAGKPGCEVIAVSRRRPDETFGARWLPLDLADAAACASARPTSPASPISSMPRSTNGRGWSRAGRKTSRSAPTRRCCRNLFDPLEKAAPGLRHVALLQGTKAYGVHVRPLTVPARENRSEMHEQPNFYWNQEHYLRAAQRGKDWPWSILRPVLIVGNSTGSAMNVIPALGVYARYAARRQDQPRLSRRRRPGGAGDRCRPAGARHRLVGQVRDGEQRDLQRHQR